MNLTSIAEVRRASRDGDEFLEWQEGDAWLAGGTWLFSEPQPHLRRLLDLDACRWEPLVISELPLADLLDAAERTGHQREVVRKAYAAPRSVAFNAQRFRIAVHRVTGEIVILQSVHAADAGVVINPMQCRGQVEGAVSQGLGWALYEQMVINEGGSVVNPSFRNYRIPAFADIPRSEVYFANTRDAFGPEGAKGMGECPINPVAPALANALADATGVRFRELPLAPDRIYRRIFERHQ